MTLTRAAALGLAALAGYAAVVITVPGQARAATAYRYWAYYVAHGTSWQYSQRGPASEYPVDGEVQGWRFAVQADAANGLLPRAAPDFATLCASTPAKTGELRVGVVIDFGLATDAPDHEKPPAAVVPGCVYVHDGDTGADVLQAATAVRIGTGSDAGLVCGIDGYPKTECAVAVAAHSAAPSTQAPAPTTPRVTPSTHPPATTATPSATSVASSPVISSAAIGPAPSAAQSPVLAPSAAQSPVESPSLIPAPATASPLSLAALRSNTHHGRGVTATTFGGIALIAILGGAAVWRTRARGR
jgi:hypothetical protein